MRQLSLFDDPPPPEERAPDPVLPGVGAQLDLFGDRMLLLAGARTALAALDPRGARALLRQALGRYPSDERLAEESGVLDTLAFQVERALAAPDARRPAELVAVAETLGPLGGEGAGDGSGPSFPHQALQEALLLRAGTEAVQNTGDESLVAGHEPGRLFLFAGRPDLARASLGRAFQATGRPRLGALLAESARRLGDGLLARQLLFSALVVNPYDVDFMAVGDAAVRDLPAVVRYELEIEAESLAWCAPVGVITGVFHLPSWSLDERPAVRWGAEALREPQRRALEDVTAFLDALATARSRAPEPSVIAARRAMKRLQPALFEVVMGRARA